MTTTITHIANGGWFIQSPPIISDIANGGWFVQVGQAFNILKNESVITNQTFSLVSFLNRSKQEIVILKDFLNRVENSSRILKENVSLRDRIYRQIVKDFSEVVNIVESKDRMSKMLVSKQDAVRAASIINKFVTSARVINEKITLHEAVLIALVFYKYIGEKVIISDTARKYINKLIADEVNISDILSLKGIYIRSNREVEYLSDDIFVSAEFNRVNRDRIRLDDLITKTITKFHSEVTKLKDKVERVLTLARQNKVRISEYFDPIFVEKLSKLGVNVTIKEIYVSTTPVIFS